MYHPNDKPSMYVVDCTPEIEDKLHLALAQPHEALLVMQVAEALMRELDDRARAAWVVWLLEGRSDDVLHQVREAIDAYFKDGAW